MLWVEFVYYIIFLLKQLELSILNTFLQNNPKYLSLQAYIFYIYYYCTISKPTITLSMKERKKPIPNATCVVITQHCDAMIVRNMCWLGNSSSIQWQQRSFENKRLWIGWCAHQSSMFPSPDRHSHV